jgi:phospholipase C
VLDHTSTLRLIETRFWVEVPNLSAWRRSVTGDMTGALNFTAPPVTRGGCLGRHRVAARPNVP